MAAPSGRDRSAPARLGGALEPGDRRHFGDQLPPPATCRAPVRRHRRLSSRIPGAHRLGLKCLPHGADARTQRRARDRRPRPGPAWQATGVGGISDRVRTDRPRSITGVRQRANRRGYRPQALPSAAVARARWRPLYRHRLLRGHIRPGRHARERRRVPHDDSGGWPLGHDQRRGWQARARPLRALVGHPRPRAGAGVSRPRPAAADGCRNRSAGHHQRIRLRRRYGRPAARGGVRPGNWPADAGFGRNRPRGVAAAGPRPARGPVWRVDWLLLRFARRGAGHGYRAGLLP